MIDVSGKKITKRVAIAKGEIFLGGKIIEMIKKGKIPKGDPVESSKIASLLAIKNTPFVIPHCHPVKITKADIYYKILKGKIEVECKVEGLDRTGFEMEALYGVSVALLTIYDMCKNIHKKIIIENIKLVEKRK